MPQIAVDGIFHVEHIIPKQHLGTDEIGNLALACDRRNLTKGPNLTAFDPLDSSIVRLFHPRQDTWDEHFSLVGGEILGKSPTGRATAALLQMNLDHRIQLRVALIESRDF